MPCAGACFVKCLNYSYLVMDVELTCQTVCLTLQYGRFGMAKRPVSQLEMKRNVLRMEACKETIIAVQLFWLVRSQIKFCSHKLVLLVAKGQHFALHVLLRRLCVGQHQPFGRFPRLGADSAAARFEESGDGPCGIHLRHLVSWYDDGELAAGLQQAVCMACQFGVSERGGVAALGALRVGAFE